MSRESPCKYAFLILLLFLPCVLFSLSFSSSFLPLSFLFPSSFLPLSFLFYALHVLQVATWVKNVTLSQDEVRSQEHGCISYSACRAYFLASNYNSPLLIEAWSSSSDPGLMAVSSNKYDTRVSHPSKLGFFLKKKKEKKSSYSDIKFGVLCSVATGEIGTVKLNPHPVSRHLL